MEFIKYSKSEGLLARAAVDSFDKKDLVTAR